MGIAAFALSCGRSVGGMHRVNSGFTLLAPLKADCVTPVSELLAQLHADQARLPFAQSETTFFATVTVIPAQTYKDELLPATLLCEIIEQALVDAPTIVDAIGADLQAYRSRDPAW